MCLLSTKTQCVGMTLFPFLMKLFPKGKVWVWMVEVGGRGGGGGRRGGGGGLTP